jgi:membrane protein implicated in regulation of membrane protease activity
MNFVEAVFTDYPVVVWAAIGVVFLVVEILLTIGFFLPFAAAGFLMAAGAWIGIAPEPLLLKLVVFAAIGVALIVPLRALLRRYSDRTPDINRY